MFYREMEKLISDQWEKKSNIHDEERGDVEERGREDGVQAEPGPGPRGYWPVSLHNTIVIISTRCPAPDRLGTELAALAATEQNIRDIFLSRF